MKMQRIRKELVASAAALALAGCGGGGGGVSSISPPPPMPAPPPPAPPPAAVPEGANTALNIIGNPAPGNLAVAGASAAEWMWATNATPSLIPGDQAQLRYDAATNTYQIQLPGEVWETLWTKDPSLPDWSRAIGVGVGNLATIVFNEDRKFGSDVDVYPYSSLATYSYGMDGLGVMAVGVPTPTDSIPASGSAKYDGVIAGVTDIVITDSANPYGALLSITGTVTLSFDFGTGTLDGSMAPQVGGESIGTFAFDNAVYSAGAYSGQFDSPVEGVNGFYGQLVGPHAEELIGGWALPFHYAGDDQDHQAIGAWVAKH